MTIDEGPTPAPPATNADDRQTARSPEEQARLDALMRELFEQMISFNRLIGLKIDSADPVAPRLRFEMRPELIGHFLHGRLHGGVISTALDTIGGFALMCAIVHKHQGEDTMQIAQRFSKIGTIDLRVDYLRPGIGGHFIAGARVTRLGGRIGSTQMTLENDTGVLIATGAAAYVLS